MAKAVAPAGYEVRADKSVRGSKESRWLVFDSANKYVGFVSKFRDTRSTVCPYKAFYLQGYVGGQPILDMQAVFYTPKVAKEWNIAEEVEGKPKLGFITRHGGLNDAVKAVVASYKAHHGIA